MIKWNLFIPKTWEVSTPRNRSTLNNSNTLELIVGALQKCQNMLKMANLIKCTQWTCWTQSKILKSDKILFTILFKQYSNGPKFTALRDTNTDAKPTNFENPLFASVSPQFESHWVGVANQRYKNIRNVMKCCTERSKLVRICWFWFCWEKPERAAPPDPG